MSPFCAIARSRPVGSPITTAAGSRPRRASSARISSVPRLLRLLVAHQRERQRELARAAAGESDRRGDHRGHRRLGVVGAEAIDPARPDPLTRPGRAETAPYGSRVQPGATGTVSRCESKRTSGAPLPAGAPAQASRLPPTRSTATPWRSRKAQRWRSPPPPRRNRRRPHQLGVELDEVGEREVRLGRRRHPPPSAVRRARAFTKRAPAPVRARHGQRPPSCRSLRW